MRSPGTRPSSSTPPSTRRPGAERPEYPLDDQLTKTGRSFALSADAIDGTAFYVLARIETSREELFCKIVSLPEMRLMEDVCVVVLTVCF